MIQHTLIKRSPRLLRWYRTHIMLDLDRLLAYLPAQGSLLDVGCGVGSLDYEIAHRRAALNVVGIDIDPTSVALAQRYNTLPNIRYAHQALQAIEGQFDCILFVDVFHHVTPQEYNTLLQICADLLVHSGYVMIKEIERNRGCISRLMDCYISGCNKVYLHNCDEMADIVSRHLCVLASQVCFRFPFPHYYIKAGRPAE